MKQRPRIYYTEEQKSLMWDRWQQGDTLHAIAKLFNRHHSSIEGILAQTGGIRPAPRRRSRLAWSPEQIAGWFKHTNPNDEHYYRVSHDTIYKSLFIQARGALKNALLQHLRRPRAMRRSRHHSLKDEGMGQITDAISVRRRPASAHDRAVPGHRERDLLFASNNSKIATLVERHTRYVSDVSQAKLNAVARRLNERPGKTLKFETPAERFNACVASIG